ncbi:hypothetical protein I5Q34_00785 [Streptomyces sp. AV19]|uniref:hypothetical protein n=1 Tax=Streptomyces sp. AV19 TaxID=2793068 RepID=UPI0018FE6383|nr:hypothetical protein [Streptomyces sp. AV19]MBH1932842.1 hypothetical protein [Streptomyces sp. AV19]MDG4531521.1 hypothetical protein [Streptomyces sp. AV19]
MASRRHRTAAAAALAAVLAVPAVSGCSQAAKAVDCASLAEDLGGDVDDLRGAIRDDSKDPQAAQEFIDRINRDLGKVTKQTETEGDSDVKDATVELTVAVDDIQDSIGDGERPDVSHLTKAADSLTKACAAG